MLVISVPGEQISLVKCVRGHTFLGETYITVTTAQVRETDLDVLPLRDFETKERQSEGRASTLLKLLVKDQLLHSGKVPA